MKTRPVDEVFAEILTPEEMAEADREADRIVYALREFRRAQERTQAQMAESLGIDQGEVSRIERRSDLHLSTLRRYVEAAGGELLLVVRFPDGEAEVELTLGDAASAEPRTLAAAAGLA